MNILFEIYRLDKNVMYEYQLEIYGDLVHHRLLIHLIVFHQVCLIIFYFSFIKKKILGWREFSKTSRPSICDLRFEEILNKIRPEKIINERGAIGTAITTSNYTNNGNVDGNGNYLLNKYYFFFI